jgi:hypothetical protein
MESALPLAQQDSTQLQLQAVLAGPLVWHAIKAALLAQAQAHKHAQTAHLPWFSTIDHVWQLVLLDLSRIPEIAQLAINHAKVASDTP